ncbi:succinylglutamate-semialdehyde dehydrogenase [Novosphingobium sp. Fuku2-ISO-50]|uniref:succinylglutamate-semialdehyde dehydrogenase n=1 Tax=Novosphingobium sp. Fuku2-ISO-50 TaxID=1739114 RepID=UPI00076BCC15|nr:succinylglutamate-semialdehyde dehydrogenase [Novosphingobium sp. Fuku2-ISO-50]KUR80395.1 N-succinylglutamate 5-semialdehyde dehydrogenase [Novosphingobium sp. Fuku2-ISO-50]
MATREIISHEPATGAQVWQGRIGDVEDAVARARRAWPAWAAQPHSNRIELVRRFANEVRRVQESLATLIARETGRPLWETRSEVDDVINRVEIAVRGYAERTSQRRLDSALQGSAALRHKPHGVMAVITPASGPASVPAGHIVPALIAGNTVIFKPSERCPASGELLVQCFHRAGVSATVLQMLTGGAEQGQELVTSDGVDGVLFTGSAHVGIAINRRLAANPGKLVALEMGGNNPIVVWDTPKITDAAVLVVQSAFAGAGQRCTAARRLIVKASMADALLDEVRMLADRLIVGAPFDDPAPFMGPVIDNRTADGLTESFVYLLSNGGRPIKHLVRLDEANPFLSPAIIDVTRMKDRPDVELFGPLLQVVVVDDFEAAIAEANATRFGLCAALVGGGPQEYNRFWAQVRAGVINWNRPTHAHSNGAPLGGVGLSGNHRPAAFYAADSCAYPVASAELDQPRAGIGVGLKDA